MAFLPGGQWDGTCGLTATPDRSDGPGNNGTLEDSVVRSLASMLQRETAFVIEVDRQVIGPVVRYVFEIMDSAPYLVVYLDTPSGDLYATDGVSVPWTLQPNSSTSPSTTTRSPLTTTTTTTVKATANTAGGAGPTTNTTRASVRGIAESTSTPTSIADQGSSVPDATPNGVEESALRCRTSATSSTDTLVSPTTTTSTPDS